ncbi:MAG: hypothetical protein KDN20_24760 [Verrucomicrobiae bacterium]|nr:hypothetical protein [Verrucomicrobiae bacterium]
MTTTINSRRVKALSQRRAEDEKAFMFCAFEGESAGEKRFLQADSIPEISQNRQAANPQVQIFRDLSVLEASQRMSRDD